MELRQTLWRSGVMLLLLMVATTFIGYVLLWGQMNLWGIAVIISTIIATPVAGKLIIKWLRGNYTVTNLTSHRFYTLHFILPFLMVDFTLIHLVLLRKAGLSSPVSSYNSVDDVFFYSYYVSKDLFASTV